MKLGLQNSNIAHQFVVIWDFNTDVGLIINERTSWLAILSFALEKSGGVEAVLVEEYSLIR